MGARVRACVLAYVRVCVRVQVGGCLLKIIMLISRTQSRCTFCSEGAMQQNPQVWHTLQKRGHQGCGAEKLKKEQK